ncbi:MAG: putative sulfate exporter family transporter [Chloroflexota bacterium]|nr:putative sulfate exporter family transporter [Chloroflexota bacterium]
MRGLRAHATQEPSPTLQTTYHGEDWSALWIGLVIFILSLGAAVGLDVVGFGVTTAVWTDAAKAFAPVSKNFAVLGGFGSLAATYVFLLAVMTIGARAIRLQTGRFAIGFTIIFWAAMVTYALGNIAFVAATPNQLGIFKIPWSLGLTGEAGYIVALIAGLIVGNLFPRAAGFLQTATRPEWFVKTAIIVLGAFLGVQAASATNIAGAILFRGFAAIVEAYLIYWAVVYFIARKFFRFSREWAAPLASGISICGVSAAIATGAAIRARPIIPVMVSSLVVIFAVVELLILPFAAQTWLVRAPMVAAGWMGLAVKTDGAAVASGTITDGLIRAKALALYGVNYKEGWMLLTTTSVKVFIDIFIGVWSFVLSLIWVYGINREKGEQVKASEIWDRFPKFILGYVLTFVVMLGLALASPGLLTAARAASAEANAFRVVFFVLTFFSIGLVSNFRQLWREGFGKLAAVYAVSLFGFVIWVGLGISFVFFNGLVPPTA